MGSHYTNATGLVPKTPFTPYQETRLQKRHKRQQHPSARSPGMISPVAPRTLDQGKTMNALALLVDNGTPASVIEHIVKLPPKCLVAGKFLLQQVLDGADVEWLTNVAKTLDPEPADNTTANVEDTVTHHRPPSIHSHISHQTSFSGSTLFSAASNPMNWSLMPETINEVANEPETYSQEVYSMQQNYNYPSTQPGMLLENPYYHPQPIPAPATLTPQTSNTTSLPELMASDQPVVPDGDPNGCGDYFDMTAFYGNSGSYPQVHGGQSKARPSSARKDAPDISLEQGPWPTTEHSMSSKSPISRDFIGWRPPPAPTVDYRSPCPLCDTTWASRKEFISHMKRNHDQPTLFICLHKRGSGQPCAYSTHGSSQFQKHHTESHRGCKVTQKDGGQLDNPLEYCRQLVHKARPKRVWGCWYCIEAMTDLDSWVRHHMQRHRGSTRSGISTTCFINSLLSQPVLRDLWRQEIDQLEASTGRTWDLRWPSHDNNTEIADLVQDLETGFWDNHDFYAYPQARHGIVKAAMDATRFSRVDLGPVASDKRPSTSSPAGGGGRKLKRAFSLCHRPSKPTLHQDESDVTPHTAKEEPVVTKYASSTSGRANRGAKPGPPKPASTFGASYYGPGSQDFMP